TNFQFSYIDVPLMLQLGIPISDTFAPRLLAGGYASVFLDGSRETAIDGPFVGDEEGTDIQSDEVNTFQYGLTGGVGVGFDLNGAAVTIDIRYLHGLSGVFDTPLTGDEADEIHHRGVSAMLGFFF
ncbi:MAG: outer membrane beta-barrel protein, partial [Bradymonadaceae bacterium]